MDDILTRNKKKVLPAVQKNLNPNEILDNMDLMSLVLVGAKIVKNVKIKKRIILDNVIVGDNCTITNSVIFKNTTIGNDAQILNTIICSNVQIGMKCLIKNSQIHCAKVVSDHQVIENNIQETIL